MMVQMNSDEISKSAIHASDSGETPTPTPREVGGSSNEKKKEYNFTRASLNQNHISRRNKANKRSVTMSLDPSPLTP